jgi:hypothetical protein
MKCPKCGYNSFEFHDSCKKCANDLTGYKQTYGLKSIVLPLEARTNMAAALMAEEALNAPAPDTSEAQADMFSFDVPDAVVSNAAADDPFNFDDEPAQTGGEFSFDEGQQSVQAQAEEDAFSDLLESTSQQEPESLAPAAATAAGNAAESDLNSFSWDDTPDVAPGTETKPAEDGFDSLFGDLDDPAK